MCFFSTYPLAARAPPSGSIWVPLHGTVAQGEVIASLRDWPWARPWGQRPIQWPFAWLGGGWCRPIRRNWVGELRSCLCHSFTLLGHQRVMKWGPYAAPKMHFDLKFFVFGLRVSNYQIWSVKRITDCWCSLMQSWLYRYPMEHRNENYSKDGCTPAVRFMSFGPLFAHRIGWFRPYWLYDLYERHMFSCCLE